MSDKIPNCLWIIKSHEERIIIINVVRYLFTPSRNIVLDAFTVGFGNDTLDVDSIFIHKLGDTAIFGNIAAPGPYVWVRFISNHYNDDSDFFLVVSERKPGKLFSQSRKISNMTHTAY